MTKIEISWLDYWFKPKVVYALNQRQTRLVNDTSNTKRQVLVFQLQKDMRKAGMDK